MTITSFRPLMRWSVVVLSILVLCGTGLSQSPRDAYFSALDIERAEGNVKAALALFEKAETSKVPQIAEEARLGAARCLVRLGRKAEARKALQSILSGHAPPDVAEAAKRTLSSLSGADRKSQVARLEKQLAAATAQAKHMKQSLKAARGTAQELQNLKKELAAKNAQIESLASRIAKLSGKAAGADSGASAREAARRSEVATYAASYARDLFREARFDEARVWARKALEEDPSNREARDLLMRLGVEPSGREVLVRRVFGLLDFERRLRLDEVRLELDGRLSTGESLLLRGRLDEAARRFAECIALVDGAPSFAAELANRRRKATELLASAVARGAKKPKAATGAVSQPSERDRWLKTLRSLLTEISASPRPGGGRLAVYDLGVRRSGPKTEVPAPGVFGPSPDHELAGVLYEKLLPVLVGGASFQEGEALLDSRGDSLLVYAPKDVQEQISAVLKRVQARQDGPLHVAVTALSVDPPDLTKAAKGAGVAFRSCDQGAIATLDPSERSKLVKDVLGSGGRLVGKTSYATASGEVQGLAEHRSLNLIFAAPARGPAEQTKRLRYGIALSLLPLVTNRPGVGLAVSLGVRRVEGTSSLPSLGGGALQVPAVATTATSAAAMLKPGETLALLGPRAPFATLSSDRSVVLLLVRVERKAPGRSASGSPTTVEPAKLSPGAVPVDLGGLDLFPPDEPALPFRGEGPRPMESRAGFLLGFLEREVGGKALRTPDASLSLHRGIVWVRGGEALTKQVRGAVRTLLSGRKKTIRIEVHAAAISVSEEGRLLAGRPTGGVVEHGTGVRLFPLRGKDLEEVRYYLTGTKGRIPLLSDILTARSTQLVNASHVTRFSYLKEFRRGKGGDRWPVYDSVDEGLEVEARPVARSDGKVGVSFTVRSARLLDRGSTNAQAAKDRPQTPVQTVATASARATLAPGAGVLLSDLPAPSPTKGKMDRLVVLLVLR